MSRSPSPTSTPEFGHKAFVDFKEDVERLIHVIADFKFKEVQTFWHEGGSYNRVIIVRTSEKANADEVLAEYFESILRVPRFTQVSPASGGLEHAILDQVAVAQHLTGDDIAAPRILALDATAGNQIGTPFILQESTHRIPLDHHYANMPLDERKTVASSVVDYLIAAEETWFSKAGEIHARKGKHGELIRALKWSSFKTPEMPDMGFEISGFFPQKMRAVDETAPLPQPEDSLYNFLFARLRYFQQQQHQLSLPSQTPDLRQQLDLMWERLLQILHQMQTLGFFTQANFRTSLSMTSTHLHYTDFEQRNVLVKHHPSSSLFTTIWEIDKPLDWDSVQAVPAILARKPPVWLWDRANFEDRANAHYSFDGDADLLPRSRYAGEETILSSDDREVKRYFEALFVARLARMYEGYGVQHYDDEAYGQGRLVRRWARWAFQGVDREEDVRKFKSFWEAWRKWVEGEGE